MCESFYGIYINMSELGCGLYDVRVNDADNFRLLKSEKISYDLSHHSTCEICNQLFLQT